MANTPLAPIKKDLLIPPDEFLCGELTELALNNPHKGILSSADVGRHCIRHS